MRNGLAMGLLGALLIQGCGRRPRVPVDAGPVYCELLAELSRKFERGFPEDEHADVFVVRSDPEPIWPRHKGMIDSVRWAMLKQQLPSLRRDTYEDFFEQNEQPTLPRFSSAGDKGVEFVDRRELKKIFTGARVEEQWKRFDARYPRSTLVALSAIGFSRDGKQGLVYVAFPGWYGGYYVVTKTGGTWRIADEWDFWVC